MIGAFHKLRHQITVREGGCGGDGPGENYIISLAPWICYVRSEEVGRRAQSF